MRLIFVTALAVQLLCAGTLATTAPQATRSPAVNPTPEAALFQERVKAYIDLRRKVDDSVPKLKETNDPKKIAEREHAMGEALIKARAQVHAGDIFVPAVRTYFAQLIKADFAKRTVAERKALIVELPKGISVGNNSFYPTTIPLATFPPNLLKAFPDLPPELEYRIVYRDLILRDVGGNYVADVATGIFPISR